MREELRDIEVIRLQPALAETRGDWPCPFCEERQPIAGSYAARVRNLTNPPLERWVRVCAICVPSLRRTRDPFEVQGPVS